MMATVISTHFIIFLRRSSFFFCFILSSSIRRASSSCLRLVSLAPQSRDLLLASSRVNLPIILLDSLLPLSL